MQLRITRVKRNGKTHEYAQLVESFRRESDGMPTHRVIASLGALSALEIENWRTVIEASRQQKRVVLALASAGKREQRSLPRPTANLRYLDAAVLLELWNEWGLTALLDDAIPDTGSRVRASSVVAALTLQRCLDPGSKLLATRWFPKTSLPELLGVSSKEFNNTRIHRVLDELERATPTLTARLPRMYCEREGAFASLFLDVTDTWFVGDGPELAAVGKTKEGMLRQKIGIVLLCNEKGYPLRWEVISGSQADCTAMTGMLNSVAGLDWVRETPVVVDRAMGHTAQLRDMAGSDLRFLTALTVSEMGVYAERLPYEELTAFNPTVDADPRRRALDAQQAARIAEAAGLEKIDDDLLVLDMGIVERVEPIATSRSQPASDRSAPEALRLARQIHEAVASGQHPSYAAAARAVGLHRSAANKYGLLRKLPEDVQREIVDDNGAGYSLAQLIQIAQLDDADRQREAFDALRQLAPPNPSPSPSAKPSGAEPAAEQEQKLAVRVVGYFNPERFIDQRIRAQQQLEKIRSAISELNASLASPKSKRSREGVIAAVDQLLRRHDLLEAFAVTIVERDIAGKIRFQVELALDEQEWRARRRYDGFAVLAAHPSLRQTATDLVRLYRSKDIVEKDFQTIKSLVELRPVRHRTDAKVRAHVTLCILALLLERTLGRKLKGKLTAAAALETLEDCRLNLYAADGAGASAYTLTCPTPEQKEILRALGLQRLMEQSDVVECLAPR